MTYVNEDRKRTAYSVSVDARDGISTGISAADRARTIRVLVDSATEPYELTRPGHVFPLRAVDGGVLRRAGHTEASVDLARLAGLTPAGVIAEIVNEDGSMARLPELRGFADEHGLALVSIADLVDLPQAHRDAGRAGRRDAAADAVRRVPGRRLPEHGRRPTSTSRWCAASSATGRGVLVRLHSECLTGDVLGSLRCDCGPQLDAALRAVADEGRGVVVYLRGHEGRGIGLLHKLRGVRGCRTAAATPSTPTSTSGCPPTPATSASARRSWPTSGCSSVRLLTNNPAKRAGHRGPRADRRRAGAARGAHDAGEHRLPAHQAGPDGPRPAGARLAERPAAVDPAPEGTLA